MEKLSDEVASFRLSRKPQSLAPAQRSISTNHHHGGGKSKSIRPLWRMLAYLPVLLFAGAVQYYGGVNEFVVELMSYTYYNYGLIHGGASVYAETKYGRLKGFTSVSREGREFYEFLGVPYASPPVGNLRFQVGTFLLF